MRVKFEGLGVRELVFGLGFSREWKKLGLGLGLGEEK
jgi:hypothetical protein